MSLRDTERVVQSLKLWFGEQKMNVLRHEYIAEKEEAVTFPQVFEDVQKYGAGAVIA